MKICDQKGGFLTTKGWQIVVKEDLLQVENGVSPTSVITLLGGITQLESLHFMDVISCSSNGLWVSFKEEKQ